MGNHQQHLCRMAGWLYSIKLCRPKNPHRHGRPASLIYFADLPISLTTVSISCKIPWGGGGFNWEAKRGEGFMNSKRSRPFVEAQSCGHNYVGLLPLQGDVMSTNVPFFGNVSESQKHMGRKTYNDGDSYLDINDLVFMYRFKTRHSLQKWLVCCPSSLKAHNFAVPHFCRPYSCHGCLFRESCPRFRESPCRWFLLLAPGGRNSTQSRMHS